MHRPYIAGLFDAEGHVSLLANGSSSVVTIANRNKFLLDHVSSLYRGSTRMRRDGCWNWRCCGSDAANFLLDLDPWLLVKQPAARILRAFELTKLNEYRGKGRGIPPEVKDLRESLVKSLRKLNRTGVQDQPRPTLLPLLKNSAELQPIEADIAYLAGMLDGDGVVGLRRSTSRDKKSAAYGYSVSVTNCSYVLMLWLVSIFGGTSYPRLSTYRKYPNSLPCYTWIPASPPHLIRLVLPYLRDKQERAKLVLRMDELQQLRFGRGGIPEDIQQERAALFEMSIKLSSGII